MSTQLIIAEKPSLAKNIANAIGGMTWTTVNKTNHVGYYEGNGYIVTYAFGHLLELKDADAYDPEYKHWSPDLLPIIPAHFEYQLQDDNGVKQQMELILRLINKTEVKSILNAGDSDREGEIIIRNILAYANNKKPVYRLWMPDQTPATIQAQLKAAKKDSEYDNLAAEGYARTYIDWLYGINLTRLASSKANRLIRVGRVTSPIIMAIQKREAEIANFKPEKYYIAASKVNGVSLRSEKKCPTKAECQALCKTYNAADTFVKSKTSVQKITPRPRLYSLSKLQGDAGKSFGYAPKDTLDYLQKLYEAGYVTYPRTPAECMSTAEKDKASSIIGALEKKFPQLLGNKIVFRDDKRIFDDSNIESHSAITPTDKVPELEQLESGQANIYKLIVYRFAAAFCKEEMTSMRTTAIVSNGLEEFTLIGDVIQTKGHLAFSLSKKNDSFLPPLQENEHLQTAFEAEEMETTPPPHYNADSLNNYLKNPYSKEEKKAISSTEEIKEVVSEVELGTEATRASLIDAAIHSGYITYTNNRYGITTLGNFYADVLNKLQIDMTADRTLSLSMYLKRVYKGTMTVEETIKKAAEDLWDICNLVKPMPPLERAEEQIAKCPLCGGKIVERKTVYCCSNKECTAVLFKQDKFLERYQSAMTKPIAKALFEKGYVDLKGLISPKNGKSFDARIRVDFSGEYPKMKFDFGN